MIPQSWLLLAALAQDGALPPAAPVAPAPAQDALPANPLIAELASRISSLEKAKSYAFVVESEMSGGGGRNREGDAAGGTPRPPMVVNGRFQSGQPLELKQGEALAYLAGDVLVHQNPQGVWEKVERGGMRGGRAEGGPPPGEVPKADDPAAGAGAKPEPGAEGRPPEGGRGPGFGGVQNMRSVIAPHKLIEDFSTKVKDVAKSEKDGKSIYSGALTEKAAAALATMGRRNRGGDGPQLTNTGSFEIVFAANGAIESLRVESQASGSFGDRTIEMKRKSTYRISEFDAVEVKLPEEAAKLFEA